MPTLGGWDHCTTATTATASPHERVPAGMATNETFSHRSGDEDQSEGQPAQCMPQYRHLSYNQLSGTVPELPTSLKELYAALPFAFICVYWVGAQHCAAIVVVGICAVVQQPACGMASNAMRWQCMLSAVLLC